MKNNNLRLWSHRHDHEHQRPSAANLIVNYVALMFIRVLQLISFHYIYRS